MQKITTSCLEHGKGSELLDNQQRASRDDAKKNIFFLMLNAGHPVCRSPIPFNQFMCIYLFSCLSVPAPYLLILHCEYLV
jgi:hypothetical protein